MRRLLQNPNRVAVLCCLGFVLAFALRAQQTRQFKPFTALVSESRFGSNGQKTYEETFTYAVRGDGSSARVVRREVHKGVAFEMRELVDIAKKTRTVVDEASESKTSYALSDGYVSRVSPTCEVPSGAVVSTVLGYQTYRLIEDTRFPPNLIKSAERWVAPELNCFALRQRVCKVHVEGAVAPCNTREATSIVAGEPDTALFEVPSKYVERSPSQRHQELMKRFPGMEFPADPEADSVYQSQKPV